MKLHSRFLFLILWLGIAAANSAQPADPVLPEGVRAVWSLNKASRQSTSTRECICLNGLWRWQPSNGTTESVPATNWGYFKVPGSWPGITDYMQKDCQTLFAHPAWKDTRAGELTTAWYQREIEIPSSWENRKLSLRVDYLNSFAVVWVGDQQAGELRFPGGELDLTASCKPGQRHLLSILVIAMPLKGVMASYGDTAGAKQIQGRVERRGLCGDVWLTSSPPGAAVENVKIATSVREWQIAFETRVRNLDPTRTYTLRARVSGQDGEIKEFESKRFKKDDLGTGTNFTFVENWRPGKLWDTHTPSNIYQASITLAEVGGRDCDTAPPESFGFREFWIDGRDFYLNGSKIFLCAVPLDNAQIGAAWATYAGTRESLQRLKSFGVNFVYTHNYGCEPGTHLSFEEVLRAADDEGMLVSFSQPHFGQYDWKSAGADTNNGYLNHAAFYVRAAQNHPSVVFYSMSHNATGTEESMNPEMIDGIQNARNQWSSNGAKLARRAEAIVQALDPSRIVYHHSSGNLGPMHTANFYANFAPVQEMSDWLEHWASAGVKPVFLCEYGVPISWDWMMYRGWYKGVREFGSAPVPWELCLAEWNAQFFGDDAYKLTEVEKECLRWEAKQFQQGKVWHRWDYPRNAIESPDLELRNQIFAEYLTENIRAFRTWGMSAFCPWDHGIFWKLRDGVNRSRRELKVDWESLQRPGFSPDYIQDQMAWMNTSFERADWIPTTAAQALYRNNRPLLAYLGGKPSAFTSKDHNFLAGETIEKQLIVINNSRETLDAECEWSLALPSPVVGRKSMQIKTGEQERIPLTLRLPADAKSGRVELSARVKFSNGELQEDSFALDILPPRRNPRPHGKIALFDPRGETDKLLMLHGVQFTKVQATADLSPYDLLVVGKQALTSDSPAPDISRVRDGLKVVLFEQSSEVLEKRFGFRVAEYGLRRVFKRVPDHPLLGGIEPEHLHDWQGEATLLPPRLTYQIGSRHAPEVKWCGIPVTRLWRAGNRGNVASVLIEKPACGNFLPILDGGFSLQFSPLLEYREGKGLVLFCQLDVTARTQTDPAADTLVANILSYVADWKPFPHRQIIYAGDAKGKQHLEKSGFSLNTYDGTTLSPEKHALVVAPGGEDQLQAHSPTIARFIKTGGTVLVIGLGDEAHKFLPLKFGIREAEHIAAFFPAQKAASPFYGLSPADVHNRDPRKLQLVSSGADSNGNGVLAQGHDANIFFCQLAPWWFGESDQNNMRRTFRRTSFLVTRLISNLGGESATPLLERFARPTGANETRWLNGFYLDTPQEWDDPYRFFCW